MAKLTESYLRGMIKQVMNEMYEYDEDEDVADLSDSFGQHEVGMLSPPDLEERIAKVKAKLNTIKDPVKLAEIENLINSAQEMHGEMLSYMTESRKSKLAPKRR
jgi:uncharacterized small protein (DUF1192 family)